MSSEELLPLVQLQDLEVLCLNWCPNIVDSESLFKLSELPKLKHIELGETRITDQGILQLSKLDLIEFHLWRCGISY